MLFWRLPCTNPAASIKYPETISSLSILFLFWILFLPPARCSHGVWGSWPSPWWRASTSWLVVKWWWPLPHGWLFNNIIIWWWPLPEPPFTFNQIMHLVIWICWSWFALSSKLSMALAANMKILIRTKGLLPGVGHPKRRGESCWASHPATGGGRATFFFLIHHFLNSFWDLSNF